MPIVLISGYASDDVRAELERGRTRLLRKLFLGDELAIAIQAVLAWLGGTPAPTGDRSSTDSGSCIGAP